MATTSIVDKNIDCLKEQHIENNDKKLKCKECGNIFSSSSTLSHHKKVCKGNPEARELEEQLKKVKENNELLEKEKLELVTKNIQLEQKVIELANQISVIQELSKCYPSVIINKHRHICTFCNNEFAAASGLSKHMQSCGKKVELEKRIEDLTKEHEKVKESYNKEKFGLITENEHLKQKVKELTTQNEIDSKLTQSLPKVDTIIDDNKNIYICTFCNNNKFSSSSSLSRHIQSCGKKVEFEKRIDELTKEKEFLLVEKKLLNVFNESLNKDKECLNKDKENLTKDKDVFANLATINSDIANTSVSAMKYLMTYHKETPPLKSIEDFTGMTDKYEDDTKLVYALISEYRNDTLAAKLANHLVLEYKKEDPSKQSIWSSDVGRLTYVIRNAVSDGRVIWSTDKNGIQVTTIVIKPILNYVKPILQKFNIDRSNEILNNPRLSNSKMIEISEYQKLAVQIIALIDNKTLERDIIKHIAPQFYWNKNSFTKQPTIEYIEDKQIVVKPKKINHVKTRTSKPPTKDKVFVKPK
jgi:hypothetical protein